MSVKIIVLNGDEFIKSLTEDLATGLQPALEKVAERIKDKFDNNPAGWPELKQATILDRRRKHFGPGPMLYRSGHLKGVAVQEIAVDSPTEGHVSTSDSIAILQNNGGGPIPARPFYDLDAEDEEAVINAFWDAMK